MLAFLAILESSQGRFVPLPARPGDVETAHGAWSAEHKSVGECLLAGKYHSQSGQDGALAMLIWYAMATGAWDYHAPRVFFEAGGYDGLTGSNTLFLERCLNWRGMLVEGHPVHSALMLQNRPENINLHMGLCKKPGFAEFVYNGMSDIKGDASQLLKGYAQRYQKGKALTTQPVPCMPLQTAFDHNNVTHFDVFALDVEGAELTALHSIDWSRTTIDILVIEMRGARYGDTDKDVALRAFLDHTQRTGLCRLPASTEWFRDEIYVSRATFGPLCDACRKMATDADPEHLRALPVKWKPDFLGKVCFPRVNATVDAKLRWEDWFHHCGHAATRCS